MALRLAAVHLASFIWILTAIRAQTYYSICQWLMRYNVVLQDIEK